jgi:hypothetical protein
MHRRIWRWDTNAGVKEAVLVTAQVYEQYKKNSRVPGAGQMIKVTEADAMDGQRKWKLWAAAGDVDGQSSMEEDEDDTGKNLEVEMEDETASRERGGRGS